MITITKKKFFLIIFFILITSILSTVVSLRDIYLVEDNVNYINNFRYTVSFSNFNYEFLFELITLAVRKTTDNYIYYFFILNIILNLFIIINGAKIADYYNIKYPIYLPILTFFIIFSSWYYTLATNGLRQGLSLSILYLSLTYLVFFRKYKFFLILIVIACLFHYSILPVLPFLLLLKLSINKLFSVSILLSLFYILGINEEIINLISSILNLPLYNAIKTYSGDSQNAYRYGFQLDLFLYTLGLSCIYFITQKFFLFKASRIDNILKIFLVLTLPYYTYGFAAFSNRYGVISWFFTIFINATFAFFLLKNNKPAFYLFFVITFFISFIYFLSRYSVLL